MLGDGGVPELERRSELAHRVLAPNQPADDHQPVRIGERPQQLGGGAGGHRHAGGLYFHTCVYTPA